MKFPFKIPFLILSVFSIGFLISCKKSADFPETPEIKYKDFVKYGKDSAEMIITFIDGDGDIGLDQPDTFPPFNPGSKYYTNYHMTYYYKNTAGDFVPYDLDKDPNKFDTLTYEYRIRDITPQGQNKLLDGEIRMRLLTPYTFPNHKAIRYEIYIYDRALHKSNVITTPEIIP